MDNLGKTHQRGIWIMVLSAVIFSTAGLFTKVVDASAWDVIFWRAVFAGIITLTLLGLRGNIGREWTAMGMSGWLAAVIGAVSTSMFIAAFKATSVANVSLIYATAPLLTAAMAWLVLRETMGRIMVLGAIGALFGVIILMGGSFGGVHLTGDLLALGMTLGMGAVMVIYRLYPSTPTAMPMVMSGVLLLPAGLWFGAPFAVPMREIAILVVFAAVFSAAAILLAEGARRVPSGQAALLGSLEAPLAPIWAWIILSEVPANATFFGGTIILVSVLGAQLIRPAAEP